MNEEPDATSLTTSRLKSLKLLGLENSWYDIDSFEGWRKALVPWGPREVYWHMYFEKMGCDAQWLMRYHRDVRGPI